MEFDALEQFEKDSEQEPYKWFMRNEPVRREDEEIHIDPDTGIRFQYWKIGMLRNDPHPKTTKVFLDPTPHIVIDGSKPFQGWYQSKQDPGHRPRPCFTEAVLTSPYGGTCPVRCGHCYINSGTRGYRSQGVTTVPNNYGEACRRQLAQMKTSAAGYFSSFTDPFQPLESIYHNSQRGAEAFAEAGLPVFFLSRLAYPDWSYDLLRKNSYSYAQKSINTPSAEDWRKMSPGAMPLADHFQEIQQLHKAGIYISIQVNPILPGITPNDQIVELIHKLTDHGVDHCIFKFAEIAYPNRQSLIDILTNQFGNRGREFGRLFTCNIGHQATIDESYRIEALNLFSKECKKAKVTMAVCYEYKFQRDAYGKIVDKIGISMGRDYVTADQCHGHRVPLFSRQNLDEPFREIEECPPSGCLHCADDNNGKARCGSGFFGEARALEFTDFKVGVGEKLPPKLVQIQSAPTRKTLF